MKKLLIILSLLGLSACSTTVVPSWYSYLGVIACQDKGGLSYTKINNALDPDYSAKFYCNNGQVMITKKQD